MSICTSCFDQAHIGVLKKLFLYLTTLAVFLVFLFSALSSVEFVPGSVNYSLGTASSNVSSRKPTVKKGASSLTKKNKINDLRYKTVPVEDRSIEVLREDFNASSACPVLSPHLKGRQQIILKSIPSLEELEKRYSALEPGGRHRPPDCKARQRVAIVIPFRDRNEHLAALLYYLHPFLQRQQLEYGIYVVEQGDKTPFNRGALMNVGFLEALKLHKYDCFIFHDVDLIPEDDRNLYICLNQPKHMSVAVNTLKYRLPYSSIFGGACALSTAQYKKINGFSNMFQGWGGEDDDISWRVTSHGLKILRYSPTVARYTMIEHKKQKPNPKRHTLLRRKTRLAKNGLSSIKYKVLNLTLKNIYTKIEVKLL